MLRSILIGLDGSNDGEAAVELGLSWAKAHRALAAFESSGLGQGREVHVVSVADSKNDAACWAERAVEFLRFQQIKAETWPVDWVGSPAEVILESVCVPPDLPPTSMIERNAMKDSASRLLVILALFIASVLALNSYGQDALKPNKRAEFMRLKLDYSKKILEGLVKEDFDAIADGARKLKRLSMAAEWEVPTIPNVQEYLPLTTDFQRIADDLQKSARAKNLDSATLAYTRMTINCVDCHKYVRGVTK